MELDRGHIALYLPPEHLAFLANQWRKMPVNLSETDSEVWANIAFRAMSALHKSNIKYETIFPEEKDIYRLDSTN